MEVPVNNVQKLTAAGLILGGALPSPDDQTTINNLDPKEVDGLIHIWQQVGQSFLTRNCNGAGGTVAPGPSRTIGIVF